jgi:hypothetical protein
MTKLTLAAASALTLLFAGSALGAEAIGEVRSWNEQDRVLILGNGERYEIAQTVALPTNFKLEPGVMVKLTYEIDRGEQNLRKVSLVERAPQGGPAGVQAPAAAPAAPAR